MVSIERTTQGILTMSYHDPIDRLDRDRDAEGPASAEIAEMAERSPHLAIDRAFLRARADDRRRARRRMHRATPPQAAGSS
jgi:hypothetical protein